MKALIAPYVARIDALALRERLLIFVGLALVFVFLINAAAIQPLRTKQERLSAEVAQAQKDLAVLQTQLRVLLKGAQADPDAANRARQAALRDEVRQLNARVVEEQRRFTSPERMRRVLEELLERNRGLTLVDMQTLPVVPISIQRQLGAPSGMYRHGIELTVRGSYGELYEYLRALERLPNQLYWSRAELSVATHPQLTLKLTVHTLSFDRVWLTV